MTLRSKRILRLACGQECTLRLPGVCNFNPETTVACHVGKLRGMGHKCGDNMVVFACSSCHDEIDRRTRTYTKNELAIEILRALEETQLILIQQDVMVIV